MTITRDGSTILNIEYSAKEIRPYFSRETKKMEYDLYLEGEYIGTASDNMEAHQRLDAVVLAQLERGA
jgi:hypothetical protein